MFGKFILILVTLSSIYIGYEVSNVYVGDQFENPLVYKLMFLTVKLIGNIAKLAESWDIKQEYLVIRKGLDIMTKKDILQDDLYESYDTEFSNVSVRVYAPKKLGKSNSFMVYTHGGGYTFGNLDTFDLYLFEIAKRSNIIIISVKLSPENPYPGPLDDSYAVLDYLIENPKEFNLDINRLIIGGDSSGGNAALALSQRLYEYKKMKAKFQILIYPWTQIVNFKFPSRKYYKSIVSTVNAAKIVLWYLGYTKITPEMQDYLLNNNHLSIFRDNKEKMKLYQSYLDINLIDSQYKLGKKYYSGYNNDIFSNFTERKTKIKMNDIKKLFDKDLSPGIADEEVLKNLPKTYMLVFEWDALKDEQLIYAERLKRAGVKVNLVYNGEGFHGVAPMLDKNLGLKLPYVLLENLVNFIKKNLK